MEEYREDLSETTETLGTLDFQLEQPDRKPESFLRSAINTIRGKDVTTMVEEFSSEVAMVIEGISDDQERLDRNNQKLKDQLTKLERRIYDLEKNVGKRAATVSVLRQITWLAGIIAVAVVVVAIIKMLA